MARTAFATFSHRCSTVGAPDASLWSHEADLEPIWPFDESGDADLENCQSATDFPDTVVDLVLADYIACLDVDL